MSDLPFIRELAPAPTVAGAFQKLAKRPGLILFDSSLTRSSLGRYSFLAAEPFQTIQVEQALYGSDPFSEVSQQLQRFPAQTIPGLPPFQAGAAGLLSYELGHCFERLPITDRDEFRIPAAVIGIYGWVLAWDHQQQRCWFIGQGFPEESPQARTALASQQYGSIRNSLQETHSISPSPLAREGRGEGGDLKQRSLSLPDAIGESGTALPFIPGLRSNFSQEAYLAAVQRVIDYITAGDIFQANLSQRLLFPAHRTPVEQYLILRERNPAPFAGYFAHDDWAVLSSSPERFLQLSGQEVSTRPIKGTRRRRSIPEADLYTRDELRESEKDRAENVMIVDLLRNDLSRVCRPGTIRVPELCSVEAYETVSHLVSEVCGTLRDSMTFWDLLRATFPGGSITGAPKIRAMQIITELEQVARGPYCGSLFYHGFDGTADSNILIRTMTQRHGWLTFSAGGGVVSQSNPLQEYEETLHKAQGLINSLVVH